MMKTIHIRLDIPIMNYNKYTNLNRTNKYLAAKKKRELEDEIIWELRNQYTNDFPVGVKDFHFVWHKANKRQDPDNIHSGVKFLLDAFVKGGYMKNDGWGDVGRITHDHIAPSKEYVDIYITLRDNAE